MDDNDDNKFRIGVVGPSRVGKTSLIAAILRDSQDLLAGTPVEVQPKDAATEQRLARYRNQLNGALHAGQFVVDAMHSTQEPFVFDLTMFAGDREAGLRMAILDYPGGWLDSRRRTELREPEWRECREFIRQSTVLIVPIDAAVMMEAAEPRHLAAVPSILTTGEVIEVARSWAKERHARDQDEPGLLLLCPLKCESYFADNGGLRDESAELEAAVRKTYADLLRTVRSEAPRVRILYAPVDTIGCVELVSADWHASSELPHEVEFNAKYRVRHPHTQSVKGADAPLISVCRHLAEARSTIEKQAAGAAGGAATIAHEYAERHEGVFRNVWFLLNGERERRRTTADARTQVAKRAQGRLEAFERAVEDLSRRPLGGRVVEF